MVSISDEDREHVKTWPDLNPEYRHEVLTDGMMESLVKDHFHVSHPDIEDIYFQVQDYILRSDLIRYLVLLVDGGVYNDLDVGCLKPIKTWVPERYKDVAGTLLGVEVDNKFGPDGRTFQNGQDFFQLVNWTIMSKPHQPFLWFLIKRVLENIKALAASQERPISKMTYTIQNVLDVTGPAALTTAFFDYASDITGTTVTYHNLTKLTEPRLIGEVVILPINSFGAGHQVEWAGFKQDGTALIHHYFAGSWKTDHFDNPQPPWVDEEQKEKDDEKKKQDIEATDNSTKGKASQQTVNGSSTKTDDQSAGGFTAEIATASASEAQESKISNVPGEGQLQNNKTFANGSAKNELDDDKTADDKPAAVDNINALVNVSTSEARPPAT